MQPSTWPVLHVHAVQPDVSPVMVGVLVLAGLGSAVVSGLALAAFARRRSRSYLLVALALATVLARTGIAVWALLRPMSATTHHYLEHGLDVVMTALVIGAVYYARTVENPTSGESSSRMEESR